MNILAFNYEYPPLGGGGGVVFQQIVEQLARRHDVTVVTSAFSDLPRLERVGRLEIHRVPVIGRKALATASMVSMLSYWPASLRYGKKLLRQRRFDVINSHFVVPSAPGADTLARRFHIPHVLSIHGGDIFDPSKKISPHRLPMVRALVRKLLHRADCVVAQSHNTADNARKYYTPGLEIDIIPLGIPQDHTEPAPRSALGLSDEQFVLVTVGRLVERKKVDDLIRVLAERNQPDEVLVVIGDGPKRPALEELARQLNVADRVRFEGRTPEQRKHQLLQAADVFASTSEHEGFGLVFLEAMDHGLPVVVYDHGGQTDFLTDGITGGLVHLHDQRGFATAIGQLHQDANYRARCAAHNREAVREFYIERCAERYEQLFEKTIERRRG